MAKNLVIFDLDGTLLDTLADLCDSVNETMRRFSSPERELCEVRRFVGNGAADLIAKSLEGGRDNPEYDSALAFFKEYYSSHSDIKTCPYNGTLDLLSRLRELGIISAIVSNKPDETTRYLTQRYFGELVADSVGDREGLLRKPAPDKVFSVMKKYECDNAIFVGDSETDVLTAKNAGIECICMTWGFRDKEQMEAVGGKIFCDNADDLFSEIISALRIETEGCATAHRDLFDDSNSKRVTKPDKEKEK